MKTKDPLISILILLTKQQLPLLDRCLRSVQKSSYKHFEIIIIINSLNKTEHKNITFPKAKNIRVVPIKQNSGVAGYNKGFKLAKGNAIFALDVDCQIFPDTLKKIATLLKIIPKKVGIIATNVYNPVNKKSQYKSKYVQRYPLFTFPGGASVILKSVLKKTGYYDPSFFLWLHEDDLAIRMIDRGFSIYYASNIPVNHLDENPNTYRKKLVFYVFRNKAWLNIKHFSWYLFPLIFLRDLFWLFRYPFQTKSLKSFAVGIVAYISGYVTFQIPLHQRKVISQKNQYNFLKFYYLYHFQHTH